MSALSASGALDGCTKRAARKGVNPSIDLEGEPVRLGERDSDGYLVGYVDQDGLAWSSLAWEAAGSNPPSAG